MLFFTSAHRLQPPGGFRVSGFRSNGVISRARWPPQAALAGLAGERVLAWHSFKPGAFGGFAEPGADADFDAYYSALTSSANWCCSGGHWDTGGGPRGCIVGLRARLRAWRQPVLQRGPLGHRWALSGCISVVGLKAGLRV